MDQHYEGNINIAKAMREKMVLLDENPYKYYADFRYRFLRQTSNMEDGEIHSVLSAGDDVYIQYGNHLTCYGKYHVADPASKRLVYEESELVRCWCSTVVEGKDTGAALLFEPGPGFYDREEEENAQTGKGLSFFFRYLVPYRRELFQLVLGMLTASILQLILPFLTAVPRVITD